MSLQMTVEQLDASRAVLIFDGALTLGMSLRLADSQIQNLINKGVNRLVFDLSGVPYCDSSGLGALVHTHGLAKEAGGMIRLCGLSDRVANMLRMTTTDTLLRIDVDRAASIAALA
jgi:anti-sigma B factor antagonist